MLPVHPVAPPLKLYAIVLAVAYPKFLQMGVAGIHAFGKPERVSPTTAPAEFAVVGDHVEMRVKSSPTSVPGSGFGMLKSRRIAVPADFDLATLLKR